MMFGESDWREKMDERKPHRNAKAIKAWADGVDVQFKTFGTWKDYDNSKGLPDFDFGKWRVKPEAIVVSVMAYLNMDDFIQLNFQDEPNLRLEFDHDTKKLIKAEVIR